MRHAPTGARRTHTKAAGLVVALALATTTAGSPAGASAPSKHRAPDRLLADTNRPARALGAHAKSRPSSLRVDDRAQRPADLARASFRSPADFRDPAAYMRAARAAVEAKWGIKVPDPRARIEERATGVGAVITDRFALPGGDLDGDGLEDAIVYEVAFDDETWELVSLKVHALRGTDGHELWKLDLSDLYDALVLPAGDLTGDGAEDLVFLGFELRGDWTGECAIVACAIAGKFEYTWTLALVSGVDGSLAWSKKFDGQAAEGFAFGYVPFAALALADAFTATNAFVLPLPSGDISGDGLPDLVVDAFDLTGLFGFAYAGAIVAGADVFGSESLVATRATVVRGGDGNVLYSRESPYIPGGALLEPAGQAVGTARADLTWQTITDVYSPIACAFSVVVFTCAYAESGTLKIEMLDGDGFATTWETTIADPQQSYAYTEAASIDLSDDGAADLFLTIYRSNGDEVEVGVVSGANGSVLWTRASSYYTFLDAIGAIGPGSGSDLLSTSFEFDDDTWSVDVILTRLDGASGTVLFTTRRGGPELEDGYTDIWVSLAGDATGDGVTDIAIEFYTYDDIAESDTSSFLLESGASGDAVFTRSGGGEIGYYFGGGDLDGDGLDDLISLNAEYHRASIAIVTSGVKMPAGAEMWRHTDVRFPDSWLFVATTKDQSGRGGADALLTTAQYGPDGYATKIEGLEGRDGSISWSAGDVLPSPPPLGTSTIGGRITNEAGDALADVCVTVFLAGSDIGTEYTDIDGAYLIAELPAGGYKLGFGGCGGNDPYQPEFFNDRPDIDSADEITLGDGEVVAGLDVTLTRAPFPDNDDIADALPAPLPFTDSRSTRGASEEAGEPLDVCAPIAATVWYKLDAAAGGFVQAHTRGSSFDTVLAAYEGAPSDATVVACNDDADDLTSEIAFTVVAGQTYWIQAGGFEGERGTLEISIG